MVQLIESREGTPTVDDFKGRLRRFRNSLAWTQGKLAQEAGLSLFTVQQAETWTGHACFQEATIKALATALGVNPHILAYLALTKDLIQGLDSSPISVAI